MGMDGEDPPIWVKLRPPLKDQGGFSQKAAKCQVPVTLQLLLMAWNKVTQNSDILNNVTFSCF